MHELIDLMQWPSMPAPLISTGPGEAWVWGDYLLLMQKTPPTMAAAIGEMTGKPLQEPPVLEYPYAVVAYYRMNQNPQGPSARPILIAGLEVMDYAKVAALMKVQGVDLGSVPSGKGAPVLGIFTASKRLNMGSYDGLMDVDSVRQFLFSAIADHIHPFGEAVHIGPISAIYGHPDTGWPAVKKKKKSGCMPVVLLVVLALACFCAWLFRGGKAHAAQVASPPLATVSALPAGSADDTSPP